MGLFNSVFRQTIETDEERRQEILQDLLRLEIEKTQGIFGQLPEGTKRDFFCLDRDTWIWYEEWTDSKGRRRQMTIRYMVRATEILKSLNGGPYQRLTLDEVRNFKRAVEAYVYKAKSELYANHS